MLARRKWRWVACLAVAFTIATLLIPVPAKELDLKYESTGNASGRMNLLPGNHRVLVHGQSVQDAASHVPTVVFLLLGSDHEGRSFAVVLLRGMQSSVKVAVLGTLAVMLLAIVVGAIQGTTRSRKLEQLLAVGSLGLMAVPESGVLITIGNAWPRQAEAWQVNLSMLGFLVLFTIPTGARLIAERIRSVNRSGFVDASRGYGASYLHTFRVEILPHLSEDLAWILANVMPRFIAVEIGLAYLGVEYRDFDGLGRALKKSFDYLSINAAVIQLVIGILVIVWLALLPKVMGRLIRSLKHAPQEETDGDTDSQVTRLKINQFATRSSPPNDNAVVRIRRLSVTTDSGREVLKNVDLDIPSGQVTAIVGESGSGKTTLLNCILNLLPEGLRIESGSIFLGKVNILELTEAERRQWAREEIGYVPQDTRSGLDPLYRAIDWVREAAALVPALVPGISERVRQAFLSAGLSDDFLKNDANRRRSRLSGGQCQRVAIAQAIVNQPKLLLMDEPTSSLDPLARQELLATVKSLTVEDRATIVVTHDLIGAAKVADWVVVMHLGQVVEYGPAHQVLREPKHPYTKTLTDCILSVDQRVGEVGNVA